MGVVQGAVINKMILPAKTIGSDVPHRTASSIARHVSARSAAISPCPWPLAA